MQPTRDELLQALQTITQDAYNTYKALENGQPVVSIGQWGRLERARDLIGQEADAQSSPGREG